MKRIFITTLIVFIFLNRLPGFAQEYTFTGSGFWSSPANWDSNGIPPNPLIAQNIYINGTGPAILDIDQTITHSVFGSYLKIYPSNTLVINSNTQLTLVFSIIENAGTLVNHGSIEDTIASLFNSGSFTNNGTFNFVDAQGGGGSFINNGTFSLVSNFGVASWGIDSPYVFRNNGVVNIYTISGFYMSNGTFDNYGTLNNSGSFFNLQVGSYTTTAIVNNYNVINNNTGSYFLSGGALNNYFTMINYPGANLTVSNGLPELPGTVFNNSIGGIVTNAGSFYTYGDSTNILNNGILHNIAGGLISNFSNLKNNATIINDGMLTNNYHTILNNNAGATLENNDTLVNYGLLKNEGILENNGVFVNSNILLNDNVFNDNIGGNLILNTSPASFPAGIFNWNVGSTVSIGSNGTMTVNGLFELPPGRFFVIMPGGNLFVN